MYPSFDSIMMVAIAGLAMSATPGPSMLYVLSLSMGQSQKAGLVSSLGLAVGGMIHVALAALGVSAVFAYMPGAMTSVKVIGAIYLFYLGVSMIREKNSSVEQMKIRAVSERPLSSIFYQGIIVELFNPKTILFFLAFLPQFVMTEGEHISIHMLILGILIPLTAVPSDLIMAITGGALANKIAGSEFAQNAMKWISGGFLIFLSVRLFVYA